MFNKAFNDITSSDIQDLVTFGLVENNNLEFKRQLWGTTDEDVREMLRDVSGMANAYGGYLIVGIEEDEETGKAKEVVNVVDAESERDRLLASLMANLQPRVIGLDIKTIECGDNKKVLFIKIPDSLSVHQITFKGLYQFWKRHDRQKSRMTYDEIKDSILKNNLGSEQGINLFEKRKNAHKQTGEPLMLITAQPVKTETELFKISNSKLRDILKSSNGRYAGWNLDFTYGMPTPTLNGLRIADTQRTVNLFRNGYIEALIEVNPKGYVFDLREMKVGGQTEMVKTFRNIAIVEFTYSFLKKVEALMAELGYDAPMSYSVSLFNISSFALFPNREGRFGGDYPVIWKDGVNIEVSLLTYEFLNPEIIAKDLCDRIWQAFGFEGEPYFNNGKFEFGL